MIIEIGRVLDFWTPVQFFGHLAKKRGLWPRFGGVT
jgi:hypothetical protein